MQKQSWDLFGFGVFFSLFGFVFPPPCRGSRRSWELGDPHNQAGKSPLRRSLHATDGTGTESPL